MSMRRLNLKRSRSSASSSSSSGAYFHHDLQPILIGAARSQQQNLATAGHGSGEGGNSGKGALDYEDMLVGAEIQVST